MGSFSLKLAAGAEDWYLKTQLYHLEGIGQHTVLHLTCEKEINDSLALLHGLYSFYTGLSSLNVKVKQTDSFEDLIEANKDFAKPYKKKSIKNINETMESNKQKAVAVIIESEQKDSLVAKMIGKEMLVWHQIVFKKNYARAAEYLKELMPLLLKVGFKHPSLKQSCEMIEFLSYFLVFTNDLSGKRKLAIKLLKKQHQYRLQLSKLYPDISLGIDQCAKKVLENLMKKISEEHYLVSSLYKFQKVQSLFSMMKEKFGKSALVEISQVIP